jgi:hypothetical protein
VTIVEQQHKSTNQLPASIAHSGIELLLGDRSVLQAREEKTSETYELLSGYVRIEKWNYRLSLESVVLKSSP